MPPLPKPTSRRPSDRMSSVAHRSATLTGWFICTGRQMTPWPIRIRLVAPATKARNVSGALMWAYIVRQVCSTAQMTSKPTSSASSACSTHLAEDLVVSLAARIRRLGFVDQGESHVLGSFVLWAIV